jgi:hypothetical protein
MAELVLDLLDRVDQPFHACSIAFTGRTGKEYRPLVGTRRPRALVRFAIPTRVVLNARRGG